MIVNTTATDGTRLITLDSGQGQFEYNFLKRKLDASDNNATNQPINNENSGAAQHYQGSSSHDVWKRRHLENTVPITDTSKSFNDTCFGMNEFHSGSNGINSSSTDISFNLIGNSFINDFFTYETNLIVPVTASTNLIPSSTPTSICESNVGPAFSTPTTASVNTQFEDDGTNWQGTDLLELDHRYNSGLQTEIEQLHARQETLMQNQQNRQHQQLNEQSHQMHQLQSLQTQSNFLVPSQKQICRPAPSTANTQRFRPQQHDEVEHGQAPASSQAEPDSDFEDKNLSWLLNFKFDELPHLSPDVGSNCNNINVPANGYQNLAGSSNKSESCSPNATPVAGGGKVTTNERSRSPKTSSKAGKKFEELVMEVTAEMDGNDMIVAENVIVDDVSSKAPKKPPFTYTELIEYALEDKGELTVSGIYQWISDRFPYYKSNDDRWKNSVRHNLSINPHFRKGVKAPQGAGHLWTISSGDSAENVLAWEHKKQRLDLFFKMESMNRERLQQHQQNLLQQQQLLSDCKSSPHHHQTCPQERCLYDEAATAAAAITQQMLQQPNNSGEQQCSVTEQRHLGTYTRELPFNDSDILNDEELRKTAGQILNGIHRDVEVQSINSIISTYQDVLLDNEDYMNPVNKDVAVNESGLRHSSAQSHANSQFYVTEIDPLELGIHMSHRVGEDEEILFSDEFNLNYFSYAAGNDIVA